MAAVSDARNIRLQTESGLKRNYHDKPDFIITLIYKNLPSSDI